MDKQIGLHRDIIFACGAWLFLQGCTPGMRIPQGVAPRLVHELGLLKTSVKRLAREERKMYFRYPVAYEEVTSVVMGLMIRLSWRVNQRWPEALRTWWAHHADELVERQFLAPTAALDSLVSAEPADPITLHMPAKTPGDGFGTPADIGSAQDPGRGTGSMLPAAGAERKQRGKPP